MDKFIKDKIKKINHLLATIAYEVQHIRHLMHHKHPRSLRAVLNQTNKIYKSYLRIKMLYVQIRIIQETPIPKLPKGGACSDIAIVFEKGCEPIINRYGGIQFSKNQPPMLIPTKAKKGPLRYN